MGGLCKAKTQSIPTTTTTVSGTQLPEWVSQGGQELYSQAQNISQQDYQPYTGQRVADLSSLQNQALGAIGQGSTDALSATTVASTGWGPATASQYMNPYQSQVMDDVTTRMNKQFAGQQQQQSDQAIQAGAFGGSREQLNSAELQQRQNEALGATLGGLSQQGYGQAMQQFNVDQSRGLSGAAQLANLRAGDITQQMTGGQIQRGLEQQQLGVPYQDYLRQQQYPKEQLNFALGALQGVPYEKTSTSTGTGQQIVQSGSPLAQGAGTLASLYGGYKMYKGGV